MQLYLYFRETVKKLQNSLDLSAKPLTLSIAISLSKIVLIFCLFPYSTINLHVFKITGFRSSLLKFLNLIDINTRNATSETKKRKRRRQKFGFLNRYDFAYAGRDVVNQVFKNLNKAAPSKFKG